MVSAGGLVADAEHSVEPMDGPQAKSADSVVSTRKPLALCRLPKLSSSAVQFGEPA